MHINVIQNQDFKALHISPRRKLVPLSEYKGPILKLTESDKKDIELLQKEITRLEIEYYRLNNYIKNAKNITRKSIEALCRLEDHISYLNNRIKQIKINRLNEQKKMLYL